MRLQLSARATVAGALGLTALGGPSPARADWSGGVDGRTSIYQDTDRTTVLTTIVGAHVSPRDVVTVSGHYLADIITSASVDVVTSATTHAQCLSPASPTAPPPQCPVEPGQPSVQQPFHETRHEGAASFAYADGTHTATVGYVYSVENDWRSHSVSASYANDYLGHRLTLGISGGFVANAVGRSHDDNFHRSQEQGSVSLDAGVVASKRDLVTFDYTFVYVGGYQASPYRLVFFNDPTLAGQLIGTPEVVPDTRLRHALAVRWNHHLFHDTALKSHIRGYVDSWGVVSGTAGTEYVVGFGDLELAAFVRGYAQKGASFWQDDYAAPMRYMASDKKLSPFIDAFGGLRFGYDRERRLGLLQALHAEIKGTVDATRFFDFRRLPTRQGIVAELALGGAL